MEIPRHQAGEDANQPTSDRMCVLKIKPPLCLDTDGADFFADALDRVLAEGW